MPLSVLKKFVPRPRPFDDNGILLKVMTWNYRTLMYNHRQSIETDEGIYISTCVAHIGKIDRYIDCVLQGFLKLSRKMQTDVNFKQGEF